MGAHKYCNKNNSDRSGDKNSVLFSKKQRPAFESPRSAIEAAHR